MLSINVSRPKKADLSVKRKWRGRSCRIYTRHLLTNVFILSLKKLQDKLKQQRKHLDELDSHIKDLQNQQGGGEQH
jgi:hypothetical protein